MNKATFIVGLQLIAFWPVWRWYAARVAGGGEDAWGLLALATAAVCFAWGEVDNTESKEATRFSEPEQHSQPQTALRLSWPTLLILFYAATFLFMPPLVRAAVALTALGCTLSRWRFRRAFHPATLGLLWLSLPLVPSLQFYGGYPLRALVAQAAAPLLRLGGFAVTPEGACLHWGGQLIWIDAPCSGVRMLWAGLYLACALVCFYRLRAGRALVLLFVTLAAVVAGNIWRAVALFYTEAGVVQLPAWAHEGIGVTAFAVVGAGTLLAAQWLSRNEAKSLNEDKEKQLAADGHGLTRIDGRLVN